MVHANAFAKDEPDRIAERAVADGSKFKLGWSLRRRTQRRAAFELVAHDEREHRINLP